MTIKLSDRMSCCPDVSGSKHDFKTNFSFNTLRGPQSDNHYLNDITLKEELKRKLNKVD